MKKLRLNLEQLAVDAFETGEARGLGTVRARESDPDLCVAQPIDDGEVAITATLWKTCPNTCAFTCQGDTCYITCVTGCSCRTMPCDTCA
ncbi:MAG TPA: hypothetical protein VF092_16650 [Longimicrobium sp.]